MLPPSSPIPGNYNPDVTPYNTRLMAEVAAARYRQFTSVMGVQMGKSSTTFVLMGWAADVRKKPQIYLGPSRNNIDAVVAPKFAKMISECAPLREQEQRTVTKTRRSRTESDAGRLQRSTRYTRMIAGQTIRFGWAGSASEVASDYAWLTVIDELDRPQLGSSSVKREGDLVELASGRGDAYIDSVLLVLSTPTEGMVTTFIHPVTGIEHWQVQPDIDHVSSPVWREWQSGTRHEWAIPCDQCHAYFIPRRKHLHTPADCTPEYAEEHAYLKCPHCGGVNPEATRIRKNRLGVFIAPGESVTPSVDGQPGTVTGTADTAGNKHYSQWVSGLCSFSPKKTYGSLAARWLAARLTNDQDKLRAIANTGFGELFRFVGEAPSIHQADAHRTALYRFATVATILPLCSYLSAGVDVQADRVYYVIRGWGSQLTSYLLRHGECIGDTDKPAVWRELSAIITAGVDGRDIDRVAIDSGYRANEVYLFCRAHAEYCIAAKGVDRLAGKLYYSNLLEVHHNGKVIRGGIRLWTYDTDKVKQWLHSRLTWPLDRPGSFYVPDDASDFYLKQLVSEERIIDRHGHPKWVVVHKHNHYLDAEGLAYLALRSMNPTDLYEELELRAGEEEEEEEEGEGRQMPADVDDYLLHFRRPSATTTANTPWLPPPGSGWLQRQR